MGILDQHLWDSELFGGSEVEAPAAPPELEITGITPRRIYRRVCDVLLEPSGLGIFSSEEDFLRILRSVASDFLHRTGIVKKIVILQAEFGVSEYTLPDWLAEPQHLFSDEVMLYETPGFHLDHRDANWALDEGERPREWHQDHLEGKQVQIYPPATLQGESVSIETGQGLYGTIAAFAAGNTMSFTCPDGLFGTIASIDGEVYWDSSGPLFGTIREMRSAETNIAAVGIAVPFETEFTLDMNLELIPKTFALTYLWLGVLAKIFSTDGEAKDMGRARYCYARYEEGVSFAKSIMGERIEEGSRKNGRR